MTQLISQRVVAAIADLEQLRHDLGHQLSLSGPAHAKFDAIKDTLNHLLHCLTGHSHEGEAN